MNVIAFVLEIIFSVVIIAGANLDARKHEWWWMSLICGGSPAFYMSVATFFSPGTGDFAMSGFLQLSFFYGYTGLYHYAVFLMLSAVGFFATLIFLRLLARYDENRKQRGIVKKSFSLWDIL